MTQDRTEEAVGGYGRNVGWERRTKWWFKIQWNNISWFKTQTKEEKHFL